MFTQSRHSPFLLVVIPLIFFISSGENVRAKTIAIINGISNGPINRGSTVISVFYVSPSGDDRNPGTLLLPWRTVQHAASTLVAGQTVYIRNGIYNEHVVIRNSGLPGQPITFSAYPGEFPVIDGSGLYLSPEWGGLIDLSYKSNIVLKGLHIRHSQSAGIFLDHSQMITVENNLVYNTYSSGIGVWFSQDIVVNGNEVVLACNDGPQEDITVAGTSNFEIVGNHVHDGGPGTQGGEGIDIKDGSHDGFVAYNHVHHLKRVGIYVDAWDKHTYNIKVFSNIVHDISAMAFMLSSERGGLLENIWLYNNLAHNNKLVGIWISSCCGDAYLHPMHNIILSNNTLVNNGWSNWGGGIGVENRDIQGLVICNNLMSENLSFQLVITPYLPSSSLRVTHNLIQGFRGYPGETRGDDYIEGDPKFVDPSRLDYHLSDLSPAIDTGCSTYAPSNDFDEDIRPLDGNRDGIASFDIGFDERVPESFNILIPSLFKFYSP